jgi:putative protein-disulfide isomerase
MPNQKIIYVWDPLCGWCFGFSAIIHRLRKEFEKQAGFEIISGGLATGDRVGPVSQKAAFIKKRLPDVERISGVKFGEKYIRLLDEGTTISDSLPPSIAFNVLKSFRNDLAFDIASAMQSALFTEGKNMNNIKVYLEIAERFEINKHAVMERYEDPVYRKLTEADFALTKGWGVEKYPSIILQNESGIKIIQKGYESYEVLNKLIANEIAI